MSDQVSQIMCAMLTMFGDWAIPETIQTGGGLRIYFSQTPPPPGIFRFVTLPLEIPVKISFISPMEILHNCVTPVPLENSKVKNQDPWKFRMMFS